MRIRVPRRFLLLGILLCSLALVASAPQTSLAKPIPWDPNNGPAPGDGDGTVVKGTMASSFSTTSGVSTTRTMKPTVTTLSTWKAYLTALRLGYGWRWLW